MNKLVALAENAISACVNADLALQISWPALIDSREEIESEPGTVKRG
jgi:hypothetical protein